MTDPRILDRYRGKTLEEMTREELIEAIRDFHRKALDLTEEVMNLWEKRK